MESKKKANQSLNELRQTKEYFVRKTKIKKSTRISPSKILEQINKLCQSFGNDQQLGGEVRKVINKYFKRVQ